MVFFVQWMKQLNSPLEEVDPEMADIIELEKARQWKVPPLLLVFILLLSVAVLRILLPQAAPSASAAACAGSRRFYRCCMPEFNRFAT